MPRGPAKFTQADAKRAVAGALDCLDKAMELDARMVVELSAGIRVTIEKTAPAAPVLPLDEWKAKSNARSS